MTGRAGGPNGGMSLLIVPEPVPAIMNMSMSCCRRWKTGGSSGPNERFSSTRSF